VSTVKGGRKSSSASGKEFLLVGSWLVGGADRLSWLRLSRLLALPHGTRLRIAAPVIYLNNFVVIFKSQNDKTSKRKVIKDI
jgi:hypothetical protein